MLGRLAMVAACGTMLLLAGCTPAPTAPVHAEQAVATPDATPVDVAPDQAAVVAGDYGPAGSADPAAGLPTVGETLDEAPVGVVRPTAKGAVVGDGTPESCTAGALAEAVRGGGVIRFDCGDHHAIVLEETLTVCNTVGCRDGAKALEAVRIDGGGAITLAGAHALTLVYANACDPALGELDGACEGRATPHLTLEDLTLIDGAALPLGDTFDLNGGGAVAMRGGRLSIVDSFVSGNRCTEGEDQAGGAVQVRDMSVPVEVRGSTFAANSCALGGAIAAIGAPVTVVGSSLVDNDATVAGGALHARGTTQDVSVAVSTVAGNVAPSGAGIDYAVPDGTLTVRDSRVAGNVADKPSGTAHAGIATDSGRLEVARTTTD